MIASDDWMNAEKPKTIKDIIKHKVEATEKQSEKHAQRFVAAQLTGDTAGRYWALSVDLFDWQPWRATGPADWAWRDGNHSTEQVETPEAKDKRTIKEEKKRQDKLKLERAAAAHGKSLAETYESGPLETPMQEKSNKQAWKQRKSLWSECKISWVLSLSRISVYSRA